MRENAKVALIVGVLGAAAVVVASLVPYIMDAPAPNTAAPVPLPERNTSNDFHAGRDWINRGVINKQ